jgi:hypothetical protein
LRGRNWVGLEEEETSLVGNRSDCEKDPHDDDEAPVLPMLSFTAAALEEEEDAAAVPLRTTSDARGAVAHRNCEQAAMAADQQTNLTQENNAAKSSGNEDEEEAAATGGVATTEEHIKDFSRILGFTNSKIWNKDFGKIFRNSKILTGHI